MNVSTFYNNGNVYVNCECIHGYAYKNAAIWVKSALLLVICANYGYLRDFYAHLCRFECLLPQLSPA